jgi:polysaccharide deacetylase family protein (PEP-CTERM system associated)
MTNALTIDVEDYHNIIARDWLGRDGPPTPAVVHNTARLLGMFSRCDLHATFFILGEVAETFPQLVRDIAAAGHELGVHGYRHRQVFKLTREQFRKEIGDAKKRIEDITGQAVQGHRAPAFSINAETSWAFEIIADAGFDYDSSIAPIRGRRYGWPGFPLGIHEMKLGNGRTLIEAPLSTVSILGRRIPACGGGYLRHFPGFFTDWAFRSIQRSRPVIVYMHPYELEQDVLPLDTSELDVEARKRAERFHRLQLRNRHTVERKLLRLLERYRFAPLGRVINDVLQPTMNQKDEGRRA